MPTKITGRARAIALIVVLLAAFMDLMDVTILNVTLPAIQASLHAGPVALEWMLSGYTLALTAGLITGARLGDLLGHKRVFVAGVAGFAAASAVCSLSGSPGMLVAARIVQGLFAAAMIPQVLSLVQLLYRAEAWGSLPRSPSSPSPTSPPPRPAPVPACSAPSASSVRASASRGRAGRWPRVGSRKMLHGALEAGPIVLPAWDPMGALAR